MTLTLFAVVVYIAIAFVIFGFKATTIDYDQPEPIEKTLSLSLFWPLWLIAGLMKLFIITLCLIFEFLEDYDYESN